jgi:hypothetical protein
MTIKNYLLIILICTVVCWFSWFLVLFFMNPESVKYLSLGVFYFSLFFSLVGTFTLIGYFFRNKINDNEFSYRYLNNSSRQAIVLAGLIIVSLIMQSFAYLFWWNMLLLVVIGVFLEIFLISYRKSR